MPHKLKISGYRRRRPVSQRMKELLDFMGVKQEVSVESHERAWTPPRRRPAKPKKDEEKTDDPEEE